MARQALLIVFVALAACAGRATAQKEPPNPIDVSCAAPQAAGTAPSGDVASEHRDTEVDIQGSTDWYRKYFIQYSALKLEYDMSPPEISSSKREAKNARLSTLMCPYTSFKYECQLDAAVIHGSASTTTHTSTWNAGATTKHTWLYGVKFLGTGGKVGPTFQFSFSWAGQTGSADATTESSTMTGTQRLTVAPEQASCFEIMAAMDRATQTGTSKLMAVYTEVWKDDGESHYYRLRNIIDIVQTAKAAGLSEAAGFEVVYTEAFGWVVAYSNTFDVDFFMGSDGRGSHNTYANSSTECAKIMPAGWDEWLPPVNLPGAVAAADSGAGGRRLAGHWTARLVPGSLRAVGKDGSEVAQPAAARRLAAAEPGGEPAQRNSSTCSRLVAVNGTTSGTLIKQANPDCRGKGLAEFKAKLAKQRRLERARANRCALTTKLVLPKSGANGSAADGSGPSLLELPFKLEVERRDFECIAPPTPRAELDARDAASRRAQPAAGEPGDYNSKLVKLVQAICFYETGSNCEVDYTGDTDWYKRYFSAYPAVNGVVGADDIKMSPQTDFSATSSSCPALGAVRRALTQWKLGFKLKATASFLGIGPSAEYETENTVDWGYSFSNGESTTTTDGASTRAQVRVPLTPSMNSCAIIKLVTRKAKAKGASRAWVCATGWVGTHQDPARNWPDFDSPGEKHYFRAMTLAYAVYVAQQKNLNAGDAKDWYIDGEGRACLYNAVDMSFEQGVMSYAYPQLFDKDSPECDPVALGLGPIDLFNASAPRMSGGVVPAIPIPSRQNVPEPWA
ncbi:hypothetical protein HT031_005844 [Scenedesmus sp. PABB004]|nr:hypothetical protein HT031_005844 [Scenedesmus sp. PABB004]